MIKNSYLIWAGAEHYPTFEHLLDEIRRIGFSKRLPGAAMGHVLLEPDTIVYLAHDDGKAEDCKDCIRLIPCPDCRIRKHELKELEEFLADFKAGFTGEEAIEKSGFAKRTVAIRQEKIEQLKGEMTKCALCNGEGKAKMGSGGTVRLKDGRTWDYRTYNYWMRQPAKFDKDQVTSKNICETCGGRGCLPRGYIHGAIVVDAVEYQAKPGERKSALVDMEDFTIVNGATDKRLSGDREAGGFYAVAHTARNPKAIGVANSLAAANIIPKGGASVHGSFIHFEKPIKLPSGTKRFRGVSKYTPHAKRPSLPALKRASLPPSKRPSLAPPRG